MNKPQPKTICNVVEYLEFLGLKVYGPNMDIKTGEEFISLMDYTTEDIIARRKFIEKDELWCNGEI